MTKPERVGHCEGCIEAVGHCEGCEVRAHRAQMDDCPGLPLPAPMGQAECPCSYRCPVNHEHCHGIPAQAGPSGEAVDLVLKHASRCHDILTHPEMYGPHEIDSDTAGLAKALARCDSETKGGE